MDFPDYADLKVELEGFVLTITLDRPHRKNALRNETVSELIHALETAREADEARSIVLTGAGGIFCSGGDLKAMSGQGGDEKKSPVPVDPGGFPKLNLLFEKLGKPTLAVVEGAALAGGLGLMLACDVSLAADDAVFGTPEIKRGLWPMMIMRHIFACVPRKKALELILTGRIVEAKEAEALGLLTRCVPPESLREEAARLAGTLAGASPAIMRLGLEALHAQTRMSSEEAFPYLEKQLRACLATEDFREGVRAFQEKRKPVWKGK